MTDALADIGVIGLGTMGENLALNLERRGCTVAVFNRHASRVDVFMRGRGSGKNFLPCHSSAALVAALRPPRRILMMVKAGDPVDELISSLTPFLERGDVLIDGGNSFFQDTRRRTDELRRSGIWYVGAGISGGETGALYGPSIMPGGASEAWPVIRPILQSIAARGPDGLPCCDWIGPDGAGHYVKMVHNGIEYGDMQLIAEAYALLRLLPGMTAGELSRIFSEWNRGELNSYLMEITGHIFARRDPVTGRPLVEVILDAAGQKGTGRWTVQSALELDIAVPTVADAVFARCLAQTRDERLAVSAVLPVSLPLYSGDRAAFIEYVRQALYASKICSYAQGFRLLRTASDAYGWNLQFGRIASLWRAGCIIRARFLNDIHDAFERSPQLENLLLDDFFRDALLRCQSGWRAAVSRGILSGVPVPAFAGSLTYFDSIRSTSLSANLIQAQRDYFGAHTYERTDRERGIFFHTQWEDA